MFLFIILVVKIWTQRIGPWEITYLDSDSCEGNLEIATQISDQCISIAEGSMMETFDYSCSKSSVTQYWYSPEVYCADPGPYKHVHVADAYKCKKNDDGSSTIWKCWMDYSLNFTNLMFAVPLHNNTPISSDNPGIGTMHHPLFKCRKSGNQHITVSCDPSTNEGLIEVYRWGLCLLKPEKKLSMKKGDLIDFSQITGEKFWLIYEGCNVIK